MFYTVYRTTNKINGKTYIGKHQTKDLNDGYIGSGKLLKLAINKYGIENFTKEILRIFDNEIEMNVCEKELVMISEQTYNLCEGGKGGFGYINSNPNITAKRDKPENKKAGYIAAKASMIDPQKNRYAGLCARNKMAGINDPNKRCNWTGRKHKPESIEKIRQARLKYFASR